MNIFLSQPMNGRPTAEIQAERELIATKYGPDAVLLPTLFTQEQFKHPLEFLGAAIQIMAGADLVVFAPGWEEARGCRIEHEIAAAYELNIEYIIEIEN